MKPTCCKREGGSYYEIEQSYFDAAALRNLNRSRRALERAITSAILRVVSRPTTGAPCTFQSSVLRSVRRTAIRGFPKHLLFYRFDSGERDSSSAWYTARETWKRLL